MTGEYVLQRHDEMCAQIVPTMHVTIGIDGERPVVDTRDHKDVVHVFGAADGVTDRPVTDLYESRTNERRRDGANKTRRSRMRSPSTWNGLIRRTRTRK